MTIKLNDLVRIKDPALFKLHLACRSGDAHPLDEYIRDRSTWIAWNESSSGKNHWSREFVFSFMEFSPVEDAWLFGGAFRVKKRYRDGWYDLTDIQAFERFEGRLVCKFHRYQGLRGRAFLLEKFINDFEVFELLPARYTGEAFCGHSKINHRFNALKAIIDRQQRDWKGALSSVKGVYHIVDVKTGKRYVGSAYSNAGIWSQLCSYVSTGHGYNDDLIRVIRKRGLSYALRNFQFSILEVFPFTTIDADIQDREAHWKRVLLTREFGFNKN